MPFHISLFERWIKVWNISLIGFEWYREENEKQYEDSSSSAINNTWNFTDSYVFIVFALILFL